MHIKVTVAHPCYQEYCCNINLNFRPGLAFLHPSGEQKHSLGTCMQTSPAEWRHDLQRACACRKGEVSHQWKVVRFMLECYQTVSAINNLFIISSSSSNAMRDLINVLTAVYFLIQLNTVEPPKSSSLKWSSSAYATKILYTYPVSPCLLQSLNSFLLIL